MKIPPALIQDLEKVQGFDEAAFLQAHQKAPVTSIRLHPQKKTEDLEAGGEILWCSLGRYLAARPVFTLDPLFHAGSYYVQEASSMFLDFMVREIFPEREGLRVLDLCGAPGGKSTLLASLLDHASLLISNEVIRTRASVLEENIVRWGYSNNWVVSNDPKDFQSLPGYFDLIVADAPCSGSGLFRKDPESVKEWSTANVQLCSQRQQRIIADVWPALKKDGIFIYATCSYSPQEDEDLLDWISETFPVETITLKIPEAWGIVSSFSLKRQMAGYRFFPDKVKGEGFFIAALRKKQETKMIKNLRFKSLHDKNVLAKTAHLLKDPDRFSSVAGKESFFAVFKEHEADLQLIRKTLFLRKTGVTIGLPAVKEWIPAHDIALSVDRSEALPFIELSRDQALKFLKKENFQPGDLPKGWFLITYQSRGLGWIKSLGNRINNYLPKHWRIRMELPGEE